MPLRIQTHTTLAGFTDFEKKIRKCCDLLNKKANTYYKWMYDFDIVIRAYSKSGANFGDKAIDIGLKTFKSSETWLASVLFHEMIHHWQYQSGRYKAGVEAEREANSYQLTVLRLIEAPNHEITHLLNQDGNHADLNGDGVYDHKDYQMRDY